MNLLGVARQDWFLGFQRGSECHVLGRLVKSRQDGLFSAAALTGVGAADFGEAAEPSRFGIRFRRADRATGIHLRRSQDDFPDGEQMDAQYAAYLEGGRFVAYSPYLSQSGGQALLLGALDAVLPGGPSAHLAAFHLLNALLSAAALTAIVLWFAAELSPGVGAAVLAGALLSQWLVGFGRNLWWCLSAFYLPMLAVAAFERRAGARDGRYTRRLAGVAGAALLLKCFLNGFEYITTTLVMMLVPVAYHAWRDRHGARALLRRAAALGLGAAVALALSLLLLVAQLAALRGSLAFGARHVAFAFAGRTAGAVEDFPPSYSAGLKASRWSVLASYLEGRHHDLRGRWPLLDGALPEALLAPSYAELLALFAFASLLALWRSGGGEPASRTRALVGATWLSLLAPLSWLLVFKAHSFQHTHMNFVVWQMPFTLFGFAVCAWAALPRRLR